LKNIDNLPTHGTPWICDIITSQGDKKNNDGTAVAPEHLELWRRDLNYAPERIFADENRKSRVYDEMWTGDWWWDTQVSTFYWSS
jgi:hypothetical protein